MNDNNKLKIRIQIPQPQQAIEQIYPDLPEPEIVYEESLDWRKISIAILLLLSVFALIGYFFFGTDQREAALNETASVIDQTISTQENKIPGEKVVLESEIKNKTIDNQSGESLSERNDFPDIMQPKNSTQLKEIIRLPEQITIPKAERKPATVIHKPAVIPRNKPKESKTAVHAESQKTSDHSQVLRAQLSHDIRAREPVDAIDSVQLRQGESKPIYFYLHLKDLQGKKVNILWYHDNKLDSQLFLEI
nr:DUF2914 domain-containing protein [Nitrosomonas sp.]